MARRPRGGPGLPPTPPSLISGPPSLERISYSYLSAHFDVSPILDTKSKRPLSKNTIIINAIYLLPGTPERLDYFFKFLEIFKIPIQGSASNLPPFHLHAPRTPLSTPNPYLSVNKL